MKSIPRAPRLMDSFDREVSYLRLSVTDRCNLRCTYCMAEDMQFLPRSQILSIEEIELIAKVFVSLGICKIRLTGGEPMVRKDIVNLAGRLASLQGLDELVMTSNGVLLEQYALPLKEAGIKRLNISIDSLKPERFRELTRFGALDQVLNGIDKAQEAGFTGLKLNAVILKGVNDDEIMDLAKYAIERDIDISYIEEMPLGNITSHQRSDTYIQSGFVQECLSQKYSLTETIESTGGPARYFHVAGHKSKVGFISPMSDNFCSGCNRVRLTAEGRLLLCLGNEDSVDLREIVRSDELVEQKLRDAIVNAIGRKPEKHFFDSEKTQIVRFMSATGG